MEIKKLSLILLVSGLPLLLTAMFFFKKNERYQNLLLVVEKLFCNFLAYAFYITLGIMAISSAFFLPGLGLISCMGLGALLFDWNKRLFRKHLVSPVYFFKKKSVLNVEHHKHQFLFFVFSLSVAVDLVMFLVRLINN